jgi:hypothetical protein
MQAYLCSEARKPKYKLCYSFKYNDNPCTRTIRCEIKTLCLLPARCTNVSRIILTINQYSSPNNIKRSYL